MPSQLNSESSECRIAEKLWVAEADSSGIVYLMFSNYINKHFNDFYF
jgi:hypothetical protein